MIRFLFTILIIVSVNLTAIAQKVGGTWQGKMEGSEFLQINIVQIGDQLCGYTWDYELNDSTSFCKAYFDGSYDKKTDAYYLEGYSFMKNSGSHSLMQIKFKVLRENGSMVLKGLCRIKPTLFFGGDEPSSFTLKKVSDKPTVITQTMRECIATFEPAKKPVTPKIIKPKKEKVKTNEPVIIKEIPKIIPSTTTDKVKTDTVKPTAVPLKILPKETNGRTNKELKRIIINDKKITLSIYDNGTIDGDTVSIFYNGKQIVKSKGLTANPLVVDVTLDEGTALHSIVLYAENLGSIPPNTALVIFTTAAGKRYEMFSSATLQQNAEIVFEYREK